MFRRVPYIEQMEKNECGLACLAMILSYYKHNMTLGELRKYYSSKNGLSFYDMKKISMEFGLESKFYKVDPSKIKFIRDEKIFPLIAHWEGNHFVIIEKISKSKAYIVNPAYGKDVLSITELEEKITGNLMCFENGNELPKKDKKVNNVKLLSRLIMDNKGLVSLLLIVSLFSILISILIPGFTKWIVDNVLINNQRQLLNALGLLIIVLILVQFWISISRGFIVARFQKNVESNLMKNFIGHLYQLPISYFEDRSKGDIIYKANSNVQLRDILSEKMLGTFFDLLLLFILGIILILQSFLLGSIIIATGILLILILMISRNKTSYFTNNQIRTQIDTQSVLTEQIDLIKDIKLLGMESRAFDDWWDKYKNQVNIFERSFRWNNFLTTILNSFQLLVPLVVLWLGSYQVQEEQLTPGSLIFITLMATMFLRPIISLGEIYLELIYLDSLFQRLNDVLTQDKENNGNQKLDSKLNKSIKVDDISFKYGAFEENILSNISIEIKKGEKVGIVGDSGSGKSTLAKIIAGLTSPTEGSIYFDGINYQYLDKKSIRKQFGVVLQDSKLFNDTIAFNISKQSTNPSVGDIIYSARMAEIHEEIESFPLKYNTQLNENAANISGGQKQRILISRAIYTNPSILILDEATSGLDLATEEKVLNNLMNSDFTIVFISHRTSIMEKMDKVYEMKDGTLRPISSNHKLLMTSE